MSRRLFTLWRDCKIIFFPLGFCPCKGIGHDNLIMKWVIHKIWQTSQEVKSWFLFLLWRDSSFSIQNSLTTWRLGKYRKETWEKLPIYYCNILLYFLTFIIKINLYSNCWKYKFILSRIHKYLYLDFSQLSWNNSLIRIFF